ncbi:MAG: DUF5301 domain-containing protein [Bacillota bacterium]
MTKRNNYIFKSAILLIAAIIGIIYIVKLDTSFKDVVMDHMNTSRITSIFISRSPDYTDKIVRDKHEIQNIMNSFTQMKFRKSSVLDKGLTATYMITIFVNHENKEDSFGITLYDQNYIEIYDGTKTKNRLNSYKITNEYDIEPIRKLFK